MKRWNVAALRDAPRRGVQDLATDPGRPLFFYAAGDAGLKTEPADGGSGIPRRAIRRCRMKGVHLERNKPLQAPETAYGATAPAVALHVALETAVHGGLAHDSWPRQTGGES